MLTARRYNFEESSAVLDSQQQMQPSLLKPLALCDLYSVAYTEQISNVVKYAGMLGEELRPFLRLAAEQQRKRTR